MHLFGLREEEALHVGKHATLGNHGSVHQLVKFIIIANGQLDMARGDCLFLVLVASVASKLQDLISEVLEGCCGEDTSTDSHLASVATMLKVASSAAHGENQIAARRVRNWLATLGLLLHA